MGLFMLDIYLYSLDKMQKESMTHILALTTQISLEDNLPKGAITLRLSGSRGSPELRFDVSVMDYETKHEIDLKIRKALKKEGIKFAFSNASNPKLNFYYGQKIMNV